jgi:hypothetical protein
MAPLPNPIFNYYPEYRFPSAIGNIYTTTVLSSLIERSYCRLGIDPYDHLLHSLLEVFFSETIMELKVDNGSVRH